MRSFVPLVVAVVFVPPASVAAYQQWQKAHPPYVQIDAEEANRQLAADLSICQHEPFPVDRSKAMARAMCDIGSMKQERYSAPVGAVDMIDNLIATRWTLAEQYASGEITKIQAQQQAAAKLKEIGEEMARRDAIARQQAIEIYKARASALANLPSINSSGTLTSRLNDEIDRDRERLRRHSFDCNSVGNFTHCDEN